MTQDERRQAKHNAVVDLIQPIHRKPLRHRIAEHNNLNWLKASKEKMIVGALAES